MVTPAPAKPHGFRNRPREHFTQLRNAMLRDPRLSLKAKGLLALMLSFPDDWTYHLSHLEGLSEDGRDAHRTAIKELIALGYVKRTQTRNAMGQLSDASYDVADYVTDDGSTVDGKPVAGKPATTNTDQTKTEKSKPLSTTSTPSPKKKASPKEEPDTNDYWPGFVQALVETWNAHCGVLPSVKATSPKRERALLRFARVAGGIYDAVEIMERATKAVAQDDFWKRNKYGLDNLLAGDKVFQRAESYEAQEAPTSAGCSLGDTVRFTSVMGRTEEGEVVEITDKQVAIRQSRDGRVVRAPLGSIKEVL